MRLTVFGATGGIGTPVVKQALARDHDVTAVVRDPARLAVPPAAGLTVLTANVMNATSTKRLVAVSASGFFVAEGPSDRQDREAPAKGYGY